MDPRGAPGVAGGGIQGIGAYIVPAETAPPRISHSSKVGRRSFENQSTASEYFVSTLSQVAANLR